MIRKEFILNELKYRYPEVAGTIRHPEHPVGRPLFLEKEARSFGAHVFVCRAEELQSASPNTAGDALFLSVGMPETRLLDSLDICVLPEDESPALLLNFVQRLFDRLDEWLLLLKQVAEAGENVEELLASAGDMLQNPITLVDAMHHVISASEAEIPASESIATMVFPPLDAGETRRFRRDDGIDVLAARISFSGAAYTLFCESRERPLYGSDEAVFDALAGYVRLMLSEQKLYNAMRCRSRQSAAVSQAFQSLLRQPEPDQQAIQSLAANGWSETDSYCLIVVEPNSGVLRDAQAEALCAALEDAFPGGSAFPADSVVVLMLRSAFSDVTALREKLIVTASEKSVRFGVLDTSAGFYNLSDRLAFAKYALTSETAGDDVAFFSDVAEDFFATQSQRDIPFELICHRSILAMRNHDRANGTCYLETLERYIQNRFNAVKTANDLFIHRSTFLYRLERMKTQFSLDLDGGDVPLLYLLLSLRLVQETNRHTQ